MSNNPALTAPALHGLQCCSPGQNQHFPLGDASSSDTATTEQRIQTRMSPTKYDVGFRRVIRHLSPAYVSYQSIQLNRVYHLLVQRASQCNQHFVLGLHYGSSLVGNCCYPLPNHAMI